MPAPSPWNAEEVREELAALEMSKAFRRAPGLVALLRFVVEAELRGSGADLKEILLGTEVYRRRPDYDPKADGIVRVNANRLRARLNEHYSQFPSRLQITLEPGHYRPIFLVEPPSEPAPGPPEIARHENVTGSVAPAQLHRHLWFGWVIAAVLVLIATPLLWMTYKNQQRWSQASLSGMSGMQQFVDFSPDSTRAAYAVYDPTNGLSSLYVQALKSDGPTKLTTQDRYESRPAWSPDGNHMAFIVRDLNHTVHVMVRPLNEDRESEIYAHSASGPWLCDVPRLSWAADGQEIITTAPPSAEEIAGERRLSPGCGLLAINITTHAVRRLTHSPLGTQGDIEPAISPDGRTIAFLRAVSYGAQDIYRVNVDGSGEQRLLNVRDDIQGLAWMPDGNGLLLCTRMGAAQRHVLRLDIRSGKVTDIQNSAAAVSFAAISPDGRHIAFTEYHQQNKLLLLKYGGIQNVFNDGVLRQNAAFSPDGASMAYSSDRTGQNQLWISNRDGHNEFVVTSNAAINMTRPVWSADGKSLIFECRQNGPSGICAINLKTRQIVLLVRMQHDAIIPSLSRDGSRLYFTSNDTGNYAGYRQVLHIAANGDLTTDGRPERITNGGTGFIHESQSGDTLYLLGQLPSLSVIAVPTKELPVSMTEIGTLKPGYILRQQTSVDDCVTLSDAGLLSAEQKAGHYHFYLYRERTPAPQELAASDLNEPIDSIAWDPKEHSILLATRSTSIGTLISLSR